MRGFGPPRVFPTFTASTGRFPLVVCCRQGNFFLHNFTNKTANTIVLRTVRYTFGPIAIERIQNTIIPGVCVLTFLDFYFYPFWVALGLVGWEGWLICIVCTLKRRDKMGKIKYMEDKIGRQKLYIYYNGI